MSGFGDRITKEHFQKRGAATRFRTEVFIGLNAGAFSDWKWESTAFVPGQISLFGRKDSPLKKAS